MADAQNNWFSVDALLDSMEQYLRTHSTPLTDPPPLAPKHRPSILIFTTRSYGKGHLSAAKAVEAAFATHYPEQFTVTVIDPFALWNAPLNHFIQQCYHQSIKYTPLLWKWFFYGTSNKEQIRLASILTYPFIIRQLSQLIAQHHPDVIISTFPPLWNLALKEVSSHLGITPKTINIITDSLVVHRGWVCDPDAEYMVANDATKTKCVSYDIPSQQVHAYGFPVHAAFDYCPLHYPTPHQGPLEVLALLGTGASQREYQQILDIKNHFGARIHCTIITSTNTQLYNQFQQACLPEPITIVGWTEQMAQYMHRADIILTKAGGATIMEAIATRTPVLITKIIPGQEEGNARTVIDHGIGHHTPNTEDIIHHLTAYLEDPSLLTAHQAHFAQIHKQDATKHIVDHIAHSLTSPQS